MSARISGIRGGANLLLALAAVAPGAAAAAWVPYAFPIESGDPYAHNLRASWPVRVEGAQRIRLRLSAIDTEDPYDVLSLYDGQGRKITEYKGRIPGPILSPEIPGDAFELQFRTDSSVNGRGFRVEAVEVEF